jgi:hypothetical protein
MILRTSCIILLLAAVGCSRTGVVPVEGVVKLDGKALPEATVQFLSQESGGRDATGFTNPEGKFRLTTYQANDGALPGRYKVIVQVAETASGPRTSSPAEAQRAAVEAEDPVGSKIPSHYSRPDQTRLVQDIPADKEIVIELTSK